jgi:uncharacterized LabA/DUF88 family protein
VKRVTFLVDGFNVYHSTRDAGRDLGGLSVRWLNLRSLLQSYLPILGPRARLDAIYDFTALATHLDQRKPGVTLRHRRYIEGLRATSVISVLGRFKAKTIHCQRCRADNRHYEEKETDVAISMKLMEILIRDQADTVALVTGDTDLAPAIKTASFLFPKKQIALAFPYRRKSVELLRLVPIHFQLRKELYAAHQLPDPIVLESG